MPLWCYTTAIFLDFDTSCGDLYQRDCILPRNISKLGLLSTATIKTPFSGALVRGQEVELLEEATRERENQ